ncbi:MAG: M17 family metallopeptidase, partial [Candidatus Sungiibacteriota bacterium]
IKERVEAIPNVTASVISGEAIKEFDLIWRVGKGSPKNPPALLRIEYAPPEENVNKKPLVLVGKGVLIDQGGVTAKTDDGDLATMKLDCSGAMDIVALIAITAELQLPLRIIAYAPFVVNMLSHESGLPGDIGKLQDGTTVEISDTDAEGRLILIDTVAHAVLADSPELVLTLATLSGNTEGALGNLAAGVFTDTKSLWSMLEASAESVEEHIAKFPMVRKTFDDLREKKDSAIPAELRNFCHSWPDGDPIRAACFVLFPAAKKNISSVHIDICGPAFIRRPLLWFPEGATGWGIRMLSEFLKRFVKERTKPTQTAEESAPEQK